MIKGRGYRRSMARLTDSGTKDAKSDVTIREIINRLAEYEDLEEQGRLARLPCAVGDTVYTIYSDVNGAFIEKPTVRDVSTERIWINCACFSYRDIGKTIFLTKREAETALRELQKDKQ